MHLATCTVFAIERNLFKLQMEIVTQAMLMQGYDSAQELEYKHVKLRIFIKI